MVAPSENQAATENTNFCLPGGKAPAYSPVGREILNSLKEPKLISRRIPEFQYLTRERGWALSARHAPSW